MPGSDELPGELDLELTAVVCDLQLDLELDHSLTAEFERAPKVKGRRAACGAGGEARGSAPGLKRVRAAGRHG
jgi:hypothetical protein